MPLARRPSRAGRRVGPLPRRRRCTRRRPDRRRRHGVLRGRRPEGRTGRRAPTIDASPDDGVLGPSRWTDIYKPTIAAVNGVAYAGGLEWACWTDLAIADEHATFGVTCRRWNIGLADGGTQRLTRILGYRRAIELIITGRVIDAAKPSASACQRGRAERHLPAAGARTGRHHRRAAPACAAHRPGGRPHRTGPTARGRPAHRGASASAGRSAEPETVEGLRRFNERDHPDLAPSR